MPCQRHPHRQSKCPCFQLCGECAASHPVACSCHLRKQKREERHPEPEREPEPKREPEPEKEPQPEHEDSLSSLVEALADAKSVRERELEARVSMDETMIQKLNEEYERKMTALAAEAERLRAEMAAAELAAAERKAQLEAAEELQRKSVEIKKKIKKISKAEREAAESEKWASLSHGKSVAEVKPKKSGGTRSTKQ